MSAAVIADGGGCIDRNMRRQVSALHTRVESGGKCRLDISLCQDAPGVTAGDGLYPVNSLRNVALRAARTDLVLSLVSGARSATLLQENLYSHIVKLLLPRFLRTSLLICRERCLSSRSQDAMRAHTAERCLQCKVSCVHPT